VAQAARKAAKAEVQKLGSVTVKDRGITFKIDLNALPGDALEAAEDGKMIVFIRELVGPPAFETWKRTFLPKRWTRDDLEPLATKLAKAIGFESVGESSASSDS
jgi:hypothetical protein